MQKQLKIIIQIFTEKNFNKAISRVNDLKWSGLLEELPVSKMFAIQILKINKMGLFQAF